MIVKSKINDLSKDDRKCIENIIGLYYIESEELISKVFSNNDYIYTIRRDNTIATFFMTGEKINYDKIIIHLGLSGANKGLSRSNDIKELWNHFKQEISVDMDKYIVYSTTTSPFIFNSCFDLFPQTEPNQSFTYSDRYIKIRNELADFFNWKTNEKFPFVLQGFSKNTIYNEKEKRRLNLYSQRYQIDLTKIGCYDTQGDRILLIHNP